MSQFTSYQLVYKALRKLGVLNRRDVLKQADLDDGLEALWALLDRMSGQDLMIPYVQQFKFPVFSTKRIYTIGPEGDFVMPRPVDIEALAFRDSVGTDYPITLTDLQNYNEGEPFKETTIGRPVRAFYNPSYPNAELHFNFYPLDGDTLILWAKLPFNVDTCGGYGCSCSGSCAQNGQASCSCGSGDKCLVTDLNYTVRYNEPNFLRPQDVQAIISQAQQQLTTTFGSSISCDCTGTVTVEYSSDGLSVSPITVYVDYKASAKTTIGPINPFLNEFVSFPPGYFNFLLWHLAIDLAPEYDMEPTQVIMLRATESMKFIKAKNDVPVELRMDKYLIYPGRGYNIYSGPTSQGGR